MPATCESVPALVRTHSILSSLNRAVSRHVLSSQRCCVLAQAVTVQLTFSSSYTAVLGPPPLAGPPALASPL